MKRLLPLHPASGRARSVLSARAVLSAAVILVLALGALPASASTTTFTGSVKTRAPKSHKISLASGSPVNASLDWTTASANLDLELRNPSGTTVARVQTTNRPETLKYDITTTGTWTLVVSAASGSSAYTLKVTQEPAPTASSEPSPSPEPSPEPTAEPTTAPAQTTSPTSRSYRNLGVANEAGTRSYTEAEAVTFAQRFDVITAHGADFRPHVAAMKAANPKLKLFVYVNAAESPKSGSYPEDQYAHDADGARLLNTTWNLYVMEVSNPSWQATVRTLAKDRLAHSGYDGIFLDVMGDWSLQLKPINPATGAVYTSGEWMTHTTEIGKLVGGDTSRPVLGNGLQNGGPYFRATAPTSMILPGLDGGMAEAYTRGAHATAVRNSSNGWDADRRIGPDVAGRGRFFTALGKNWTSADPAVKAAEEVYALATFLLVDDGTGVFGFSMSKAESLAASPVDTVDIGTPAGAAVKHSNGGWTRDFTRGQVLVNPTTGTITLNGVSVGPTSARIVTS